jgi:hypothetical protein
MENNSFQDIVSGASKSIRSISVSKKPKLRRSDGPFMGRGDAGENIPLNRSDRKKSSFRFWVFALVAIIILFFVFSMVFAGVKVKVTPKQSAVLIDGEFSAFKEVQSGELKFEVMTVDREASEEIAATGEEFVETKASGRIVVYNNYGTASQKLIKDTRFETPEGLIFRIKDAVTIPGRKVVNGETVPGSLEVTVYADKAGDSYNVGLKDFTVPGLKGDPRYSKVYGRSKTPMEGGFSGKIKKASEKDLSAATERLNLKLKAEILEQAMSLKPQGFTLLNNAYILKSETKTSNGTENNVLVTQKVTLNGLIFNEKDFAKFVAENTIASYAGEDVELVSADNLNLSIKGAENIDLNNVESVNFKLTGDAKVVWLFDEPALLNDLKGMPKNQIDGVLSKYPGIETAEVVVRPFWNRSVTEDVQKIKLERVIK